jgi:hypothetical protein
VAKFKFYLYAKRSIEQVLEIPDDELTGMSVEEKQVYIRDRYFEDWLGDYAEIGFRQSEEE